MLRAVNWTFGNCVFKGSSSFGRTQSRGLLYCRKPKPRKPIYLGTAKSKLLRFPQHKPLKPGENEEMKKLYDDYRHAVKCISLYFKGEYEKMSASNSVEASKLREEEEEHKRLMLENQKENERLAALREKRVAEMVAEEREKILLHMEEAEKEKQCKAAEAEVVVRQQKELAKTFITLETLDDAIEEALANEVDYNFSIDLSGNVYVGRLTRPDNAQPAKIASLELPVPRVGR